MQLAVRDLCVRPYYNHPRGCPNHGKRPTCPPQASAIGNILDLRCPVFAIYYAFPFAEHVEKMRRRHPDWTERQVECCLYWQGTARKRLKVDIEQFKRVIPCYWVTESSSVEWEILWLPEANGVNMTETMQSVGIELEWPPKNWAYKIVLAGVKRFVVEGVHGREAGMRLRRELGKYEA